MAIEGIPADEAPPADLFGHPDLAEYAASLEAALGWVIGRARVLGFDLPALREGLAHDTAVDIDPRWALHLIGQATHPDD